MTLAISTINTILMWAADKKILLNAVSTNRDMPGNRDLLKVVRERLNRFTTPTETRRTFSLLESQWNLVEVSGVDIIVQAYLDLDLIWLEGNIFR